MKYAQSWERRNSIQNNGYKIIKTRHVKWGKKNFKVIIIWNFTSNKFFKQSVKRGAEINVST